jgi:hypothetical protein
MKKLIYIMMSILILLPSLNFANGADWVLIGKSKDGNKYLFIDHESVRQKTENVVTSCAKYSYVNPILFDQIKKPVIEIVADQEWDCDEEKYNNLQLTFYHTDGTNETETYKEPLWHYVRPDTLESDFCEYLCNQ